MNTTRLLLVFLLALIVSACASSYRVVQPPQYGADLYPRSQTKSAIAVAIDEMKSPERVERLFGADLIGEGILPVNVVVSNYGKLRLLVKPSDILLYRGKEVIDPIPVEMVMTIAKRQKNLRASTAGEVDKYFEAVMFKEMEVYPGETYRGVMFFALPAPKGWVGRFFTAWSRYYDEGLRLRVGVTNMESGERVLFAPFPVKMPENAGRFSY
jgi:hypothetical protein